MTEGGKEGENEEEEELRNNTNRGGRGGCNECSQGWGALDWEPQIRERLLSRSFQKPLASERLKA